MAIKIESSHKKAYEEIIRKSHKKLSDFSLKSYKEDNPKAMKIVDSKNMSVTAKKAKLTKMLSDVLIKSLSIDIDKVNKKKIVPLLRNNIDLARIIVSKLENIDLYLGTMFLKQLKKHMKGIKISKRQADIPKKELEVIEHTAYKLIDKLIHLDEKTIKRYKQKEEKIIKDEKKEVKDLSKGFEKEVELLYHIESKLPPSNKLELKLLQQKYFSMWVSMVWALLAAYINETEKDKKLLKEISKNKKIKQYLDKRISSLEKEQAALIKANEQRLVNTERFKNKQDILFDWVSISSL